MASDLASRNTLRASDVSTSIDGPVSVSINVPAICITCAHRPTKTQPAQYACNGNVGQSELVVEQELAAARLFNEGRQCLESAIGLSHLSECQSALIDRGRLQ